jgi:hypothetical protein
MQAIFYLLGPPDAGEPFAVGPPLTICEAAMVYAGWHPHGQFLQDSSVADHKAFIRPNQPAWNAYCDLMGRAERGSLALERTAYLRDGTLDPRHTRIAFEALLELAQERGDAHEMFVDLARCYDPGAGGARTTNGAETQCAHWLKGSPASPVRRKKDVKAEAIRLFGPALSGRSFDRAWHINAPAAWKRAGSKAKIRG